MSDDSVKIWVKTEKGQVFGPLVPTSVELLFDNGVIEGFVQVSLDGSNYVSPGRMPGVRMVFPKMLWGPNVLPRTELDDAWETVAAPTPLPEFALGAPAEPPLAPVADHIPRPGAGAIAGPGTRVQASTRPLTSAAAMPQFRLAKAPAPPSSLDPSLSLEDALFSDLPRSSPSALASSPSGIRGVPMTSSGSSVSTPSGLRQAPVLSSPSNVSSPSGLRGAPMSSSPSNVSSPSGIRGAPMSSSPSNVSSPSGIRGAPMSASAIAAAMQSPPPTSPSVVAAPVSGPSGVSAPFSSAPSIVAVAALAELPASGTLRVVSAQRLYFLAAAQDLNGLLTFNLRDRSVLLHFRKGNPDSVESSHPDDALATFLLKNRLVSLEQLGQAQKEGGRFGGELLPALFGLGLVNPNVVLEALGKRSSAIIGQALCATDGHFTFQPIELPAHKAIPAGNRWQIYVEELRRLSTAELRARMYDALDLPVMKASGSVPVTALRLSPQETRAYSSFDGTRTLNQLFASQVAEADSALRVAFMLQPCDLVSFAGTVVKTRVSEGTAAVPVAGPVMPAPASPLAPPPAAVPSRPVISVPVAVAPPPQPQPVVTPQVPSSSASAVPARPVITPQVLAAAPSAAPARPVITPQVLAAAPTPAPSYPVPTAAPARTSAPTSSGPSRIGTAAAPVAALNFDAEVKRLAEVLAKMKSQNHFEVLSLTTNSPTNAVKVAYFKLAKDYHPDTVPPGAPEALAKAKADVFARVGEAHRTLSDENLRKEYVAELAAGGAGEKVDVGKFLLADELFQKGKILMQARKYAEACKAFDECIGIMPDDAEVYAWRGYAKFLMAPDKKAALGEALKDMLNCLKRNPNIVAAHFHQGMMHRILGDMPTAKKHFKAAVMLDPKHLDAQRELRMIK
jgi:DnaJ-domain-containing protein 1